MLDLWRGRDVSYQGLGPDTTAIIMAGQDTWNGNRINMKTTEIPTNT